MAEKSLREGKRERERERLGTIKMKNDVLADIPATITLTLLSVVTSHPSERANSRIPHHPSELLVIF